MKDTFKTQLITGLLSSPIIYIPHSHYAFVDEIISEIIKPNEGHRKILDLDYENIIEFDVAEGIIDFKSKTPIHNVEAYSKSTAILSALVEYEKHFDKEHLFIFKNFIDALTDCKIQAYLQTFAHKYERGDYDPLTTILIVSPHPVSALPLELEKYIKIVDLLPPSISEIEQMVQGIEVSAQWKFHENDLRMEFCRNLQGLQLLEIRQILSSCLIRTGGKLTKQTIRLALEEKKGIVRKSGIIEVVDTDISFSEVGGLEVLKEDLLQKSKIFRHLTLAQSKLCKIVLPKGVLIIGMPGCGKSLIAKAIAHEFGVSLLRLDVSRLMGQYVGQSEENLRRALSTAEAAHPCVLWIDEIEKAFAGSNNSAGNNDMLVMRMMGYFLTWMQERKSAVYIVATANDVMRPEFMRKGRFDEVYFVDFPNENERREIFQKKIDKYANTPTSPSIYDFSSIKSLDKIVKEAVGTKSKGAGFSGSEIESVINTVIERKFIQYVDKLDNDEKVERISITENDIIDVVKDLADSVLCNQRAQSNNQEMSSSAIQRIDKLKSKFKSASKSK